MASATAEKDIWKILRGKLRVGAQIFLGEFMDIVLETWAVPIGWKILQSPVWTYNFMVVWRTTRRLILAI